MIVDSAPSEGALAAFGIDPRRVQLERLPGGRGRTFRADTVVLRPSVGDGETVWKAEILSTLPRFDDFRTPRPVRGAGGAWTAHGWEAWEWLPGRTDPTRTTEVLSAGNAFHRAVEHLPRPAFLDVAADPWARADRIAWEEERVPDGAVLKRLAGAFRAVDVDSQVIHGDLLGNVMFAQGEPPTIIDWAPYWRPVGYADAIVIADAACWHGLGLHELRRLVDRIPEGRQMLVRALVFRIATLHLLGHWDEELEVRHELVVDAALH